MTYLVDSDYVADWLKGRSAAIQLLTTLRQDGLAISDITYGEIYEGIYYGRGVRAVLRSVGGPGLYLLHPHELVRLGTPAIPATQAQQT